MKFQISRGIDSRKTQALKLLYLIPFVIISYPVAVIVEGIKEVGNPFDNFIDILTYILKGKSS